MKKQDFSVETKIELIKFFCQAQYEELNFRRKHRHKIVTWSSSILLGSV